ncbi:MAG: (Fe-S)-binding protein [Myxococcota bacterium]|nr:(Fe-S)-binding protein [Myxococcota bacterium]MDW8362982.1 (Fe-S)-binding protein [Myxococcales bacterium]
MGPTAMTLIFAVTLGAFAWSAHRRWRQLVAARPVEGWSLDVPTVLARLRDVAVYALGQRRMPNYPVAGIAHVLIFAGFCVLLLRTIVLWGRAYDPSFDLFGVLAHGTLLGDGYAWLKDTFAVLVLVGVGVFLWLRLVRRERRMTLSGEGLLILGIIATMMVADLIYDGAARLREARLAGEPVAMHPWEWAGSLTAMLLSGIESDATLRALWASGYWTHATLVLVFLNILPYSKHFHILTSLPNVFTRDREPTRLAPIADLEGKVEREEPVGLRRVSDLTWKHVLDLYTCTECGRCSDNCPAYTTGKKLSPKHLTLALRDHLYETERATFGEGRSGPPAAAREPLATHPPAPAGGYFRSGEPVDLVPGILSPEVVWACTTCRACEEQCPVMISYVDKIVGLRRDLVMMRSEFPGDLARAFKGMETNGNPWNQSAMDRADWTEGLDVPLLSDRPEAPVLYWVGCAASYDDRARRVARATVRLLRKAGVDFAILGPEECCTGDPARRAGNEYLFEMLARQNVETLEGYRVADKTVLTTCPHCFHTLRNEYPDFGGRYRVVHHTAFLADLVESGRLRPERELRERIAYHDSCYLGRYNGVYDPPRAVLQAIAGVELVEVPGASRARGLCCGAGGAQYFMEEQPGEQRVSVRRTTQLIGTGARTLASACPFCATMIGDGLKRLDEPEGVRQLDVAEILLEACEPRADDSASAS